MRERVAGAPISWGVCEVPGWGVQLSPERVLSEMTQLGIRATELGPEGFLPTEPLATKEVLEAHQLSLVGGFVPVALHRADRLDEELEHVRRSAEILAAGGSTVMVLAAATGEEGYEARPELSDDDWKALARGLDRAGDLTQEAGLLATLHPHVGTLVERPDEVDRVLELSSIPLCLDTGHLLAGGGDPAALAAAAPERIAHVHLKDVHADLAEQVREGRIGYRDAVARGMYRRLGEGDVDMASVIGSLERADYRGWYVLEQDLVLSEEPAQGEGPIRDVEACMRFLEALDGTPEWGVTRRGDQAPTGGSSSEARRG